MPALFPDRLRPAEPEGRAMGGTVEEPVVHMIELEPGNRSGEGLRRQRTRPSSRKRTGAIKG